MRCDTSLTHEGITGYLPLFIENVFLNRCVATFMARMGQCFSTSMDAIGIDVNEGTSWAMDEDIKTPNGGYCFSDGVGRISESLAQQVKNLNVSHWVNNQNPSHHRNPFAYIDLSELKPFQ